MSLQFCFCFPKPHRYEHLSRGILYKQILTTKELICCRHICDSLAVVESMLLKRSASLG